MESEEIIKRIAQKFNFEIKENSLDLQNVSNKEVMDFFYSLKKTGKFVFHGTNAEEKFDILEPQQANDASKESGNKKAIYADTGVTVPLASALLNKKYISSKFKSFVNGWGDKNGKMIFKFSPNVFALFTENDSNLFGNGYVYILDKSNFSHAEDAGTEWHSEINQKPIFSCSISKKLAKDIFVTGQGDNDTVYEYSPEEMERIIGFNKNSKNLV